MKLESSQICAEDFIVASAQIWDGYSFYVRVPNVAGTTEACQTRDKATPDRLVACESPTVSLNER